MKLVTLKKNQLKYFKELDPFEFRDKKGIKLSYLLGALCEPQDFDGDTDVDGNIPVGLMLCTVKDKSLIIVWIYVDPAFRRKGIGELMLLASFERARAEGLSEVAALFPNEYGRELVCRTEKRYFEEHGFYEEKKGVMKAKVSDFDSLTFYDGPSYSDEAHARERLLTDDIQQEAESADADYDDDVFFEESHKDWETLTLVLKELSELPRLHRSAMHVLKGEAPVKVGGISELTLMQYRQGLTFCEKNGHSGYPKSLYDIPADYFDLDISSYVMEDTVGSGDYSDADVCGLCLIHYNKKQNVLYVELLFAKGNIYPRALAEMIRYTITAARDKYSADTKVILPNDKEFHRPIIEKIL